MAQLPNFEKAEIDIRKLRDYCLNRNHPTGKHKAQVFESKLGLAEGDAQLLKKLIIRVPMRFKRRGGRKQIILPRDNQGNGPCAGTNAPMASAVARAHRWLELLEGGGPFLRVSGLAMRLKTDEAYVRRQLRLTLLAPDIVEAIFDGREPSGLSIDDLMKAPVLWEEQRRRLGFDSEA